MGELLNDAEVAVADESREMRKPYVDAGLARLVAGIDAYLSDEFTFGIGQSIEKVVATEAPIEKGMLFNEVCRSYGTDAGAIDVLRKNETILKGIPHKETRFGGSVFVWRADQDPSRYFEYRVTPKGEEGRFIGRVSYEELSALLYDVAVKEAPVDVDLLIDIALGESGYSGPKAKARSVLKTVFDQMRTCGLVETDDAGDVQILRALDDVLANGTGAEQVSKVAVVTGERARPSQTLDAQPSQDRSFDAQAAGIRRSTGQDGAQSEEPQRRSLTERYQAENAGRLPGSDKKRSSAKASGEKRQRRSSAVKATGGTAGAKLTTLGEEQGVLSNPGDAKLFVPDAPAGGDLLAQRYMDPQTKAHLIGATVAHARFGTGKIKKIDGNRVIMAFGGELKQFVYPTIFLGDIVKLVDRQV